MHLRLSILVPTFNRLPDLRRLVPQLLATLKTHRDVEVVVSNNASIDGTSAYLDGLRAEDRLRIVHQPLNYGPHIHLAWLYGQARGEFLWLFCDDDLFAPGTVEKLLETVRINPNVGWIHLPHVYLRSVEPEVVQASSEAPPEDRLFPSGRQVVAGFAQWVTFASSNVVRTSLIQPQIAQLRFETMFWPWRLLALATKDQPAVVLARHWVKAGPDISWRGSMAVVTNEHLPRTIIELEAFSRAERRACLKHIFRVEPDRLERLVAVNPWFLIRLLMFSPSLMAGFFRPHLLQKIFKASVWRRLFRSIFKGDKEAVSPRKTTITLPLDDN